jgi:hypothetical protein
MTNTRLAALGYVMLALAAGLFLEHVLLAAFGAFGPTQLTRPALERVDLVLDDRAPGGATAVYPGSTRDPKKSDERRRLRGRWPSSPRRGPHHRR